MRSKLRIKHTVIAVGALAVGLVAVPPAFSASKNECLGGKPTVVGTKGDDVISVSGYEEGFVATVNGKRFHVASWEGQPIIFGDKGDDRITYSQDSGGAARVCGGAGKDTITGTDIYRIHGGDGYDTVDVLDKCGGGFEIFAVENVRTDALVGDSWDPGPCN
jgi:Ca2+-binding RTX toxin-like protein